MLHSFTQLRVGVWLSRVFGDHTPADLAGPALGVETSVPTPPPPTPLCLIFPCSGFPPATVLGAGDDQVLPGASITSHRGGLVYSASCWWAPSGAGVGAGSAWARCSLSSERDSGRELGEHILQSASWQLKAPRLEVAPL